MGAADARAGAKAEGRELDGGAAAAAPAAESAAQLEAMEMDVAMGYVDAAEEGLEEAATPEADAEEEKGGLPGWLRFSSMSFKRNKPAPAPASESAAAGHVVLGPVERAEPEAEKEKERRRMAAAGWRAPSRAGQSARVR